MHQGCECDRHCPGRPIRSGPSYLTQPRLAGPGVSDESREEENLSVGLRAGVRAHLNCWHVLACHGHGALTTKPCRWRVFRRFTPATSLKTSSQSKHTRVENRAKSNLDYSENHSCWIFGSMSTQYLRLLACMHGCPFLACFVM